MVWAFQKEMSPHGLIYVPSTTTPISDEDIEALDKLVEELENDDDVQEVYTNAE